MPNALILETPFPPSLNSYWRRATIRGRPGMRISDNGKAFRRAVIAQIAIDKAVTSPFTGPVEVRVILCPPTKRAYDIDNFVKALFDAFTYALVWNSDGQIDKLTIERGPVGKPGKARVFIRAIL